MYFLLKTSLGKGGGCFIICISEDISFGFIIQKLYSVGLMTILCSSPFNI